MSAEGMSAGERLSEIRRVDLTCDRFEGAWKASLFADEPPRLEDFLDGASDGGTLLTELIPLDVHYRQARGDAPRPEDYARRFPQLDAAWLADVTAARPTAPVTPLDLAPFGGPPPITLGRFRVRRELGRGGFGIVFLAEDPRLGREVALKVPRPELAGQPELRQRFLREAHSAAALDHPNVAPVHEAGEADGVCYIASAYCPGGNLAAWLRRRPAPVSARHAATIVASLAGAVKHAHDRGILHRDLKPSNILLVPLPASDGEAEFVPKVTDFGLAKLMEETGQETTSGMLLGTPAYMAPEQVEARGAAVGVATDVYALGVILYEVLTGRVPFQGQSLLQTLDRVRAEEPPAPRVLRPDVPRDLEVICLKCLQKSQRDRYASAAELAADLHRFLRHEPIRARRAGRAARLWRWCGRPERVRNARFVAILNGAVATAINATGIGLLLGGLMPSQDVVAATGFFLFFLVFFGLANLWIGLGAAAPDVRRLWCGLLIPVAVGIVNVLSNSGAIPSGGMVTMHETPVVWYAQIVFLLTLFGMQIVAFALGLVAHYSDR